MPQGGEKRRPTTNSKEVNLLRLQQIFKEAPSVRDVASKAGIAPETLSRVMAGKQRPSFAPGGSAERIAQAIGWTGDPAELFKEVD